MTLIDKLVAFAVKTYGGDLVRRRDDILDRAYEWGFEGDDDILMAQVIIAARSIAPQTASSRVAPGRPQGARNNDTPQVRQWTAEDINQVTAPFRFVALNTTVSILPQDTDDEWKQSHSKPCGTFSAVLKVEWAVETPLLIGEQLNKDDTTPFRLGDDWAILGSTLRGMIRSTVETVAFARLQQINRHRRFALRNFEHPHYKEFVQASQADEQGRGGMQAGWLRKTEHGPTITPCPWAFVEIDDIRDSMSKGDWVKSGREIKYKALGVTWRDRNAFAKSRGFGPEVVDNRRQIRKPVEHGGTPGFVVVSGPVPAGRGGGESNKRFEYVFLDAPDRTPLALSDRAWEEFIDNNSKPSANKRSAEGAWKEFERCYNDGGRIPIFFVGSLQDNATDSGFSFGLTRLYRIPHKRSVGEMLAEGAKAHLLAASKLNSDGKTDLKHSMDFAEHLFGYVHEPADLVAGHKFAKASDYNAPAEVSRKSRVAFGFARALDADFLRWPDKPQRTVMGAPKASFAPFYLSGPEKDWSSPKSQLAGRKRYLVRYDSSKGTGAIQKALAEQVNEGTKNEQATFLQFITPVDETKRFKGDIRLHNVSCAELGAILWAVGLGGDPKARHLMGRAKAFGAGQLRAAKVTLHVRDNTTNMVADAVEWVPQEGSERVASWLDAFADTIANLTGQTTAEWAASDQVQGLLATCRPSGDGSGTTYLPYLTQDGTKQRQAQGFAQLRKKTGIGAGVIHGTHPPRTLLPARNT